MPAARYGKTRKNAPQTEKMTKKHQIFRGGKYILPPQERMQDCMQKSIFSDYSGCKPLDVVHLAENGKNKRSNITRVNITMLT